MKLKTATQTLVFKHLGKKIKVRNIGIPKTKSEHPVDMDDTDAYVSWETPDGKTVVNDGLYLTQSAREYDVCLAIQHEVLHQVLARDINLRTSIKLDNLLDSICYEQGYSKVHKYKGYLY